jgi:hypothetical protein
LAISWLPQQHLKDYQKTKEAKERLIQKRARKRWKTKMNERKKKDPNKKRGRKCRETNQKA